MAALQLEIPAAGDDRSFEVLLIAIVRREGPKGGASTVLPETLSVPRTPEHLSCFKSPAGDCPARGSQLDCLGALC